MTPLQHADRDPASLAPVVPETHAVATASAPSGGGTILLVEDDQPLRQLASRILRNAGSPGRRVIYMSGYAENTIRRREKVALGSYWLGKPFSPHEFLSEAQNRLQTRHEILR